MIRAQAKASPRCWVLSDGKAGTEVQSVGLAEALGLDPEVRRLELRAPWRWLPPRLWLAPLAAVDPKGTALAPPWPRILIAGGRLTAAPAAAIRRAGNGACFAIQIQDSKLDPRCFDLVVTPEHDRLRGPNVLTTRGALHRVTLPGLAAAAALATPRLGHLPRPRVAVLIGGTSRTYAMSHAVCRRLAKDLGALACDHGAGLMITVSRRTGAENEAILRAALRGSDSEFWDGRGENPYLGYLGLADAFVITEDSVTMISEAAATGKPIHVVPLSGGSTKFARFHESMRNAGITRPFAGKIEYWDYSPLDETARIAAEIRRRLGLGTASEAGLSAAP